MFKIDEELTIHITRGDAASISFSALKEQSSEDTGNDDILDDDDILADDELDPDIAYPNGEDYAGSDGDGNIDSEKPGTITKETKYEFRPGDTVRLTVTEKKNCDIVVLQKDFLVEEPTYTVTMQLNKEDTKIGEEISKPVDYWYEIELNPETLPQTIIGYDETGPKVLRMYPEGGSTK